MQKHLELLTLSAKYVAFAARREPQCTAKNILELTITGKIKMNPAIPDALFAASIETGLTPASQETQEEVFVVFFELQQPASAERASLKVCRIVAVAALAQRS